MRRNRRPNSKRFLRFSLFKVLFFLFILLILGLGFFIYRIGLLNIKSVNVNLHQVDCASKQQIMDQAGLIGQNFFLLNKSAVANNLKTKFLCVGMVEISRNFPSTVILNISGRTAAAILTKVGEKGATASANLVDQFSQAEATDSAEASGSAQVNDLSGPSFLVDVDGVIYSNKIEQIVAPRVYISDISLSLGQTLSGSLIISTLKILSAVKNLGIDPKESQIYSKSILLISSTPKMIFLLDDKINEQIASLQLIYGQAKIDHKTLEFIDLRFDKPVVKFAPKK